MRTLALNVPAPLSGGGSVSTASAPIARVTPRSAVRAHLGGVGEAQVVARRSRSRSRRGCARGSCRPPGRPRRPRCRRPRTRACPRCDRRVVDALSVVDHARQHRLSAMAGYSGTPLPREARDQAGRRGRVPRARRRSSPPRSASSPTGSTVKRPGGRPARRRRRLLRPPGRARAAARGASRDDLPGRRPLDRLAEARLRRADRPHRGRRPRARRSPLGWSTTRSARSTRPGRACASSTGSRTELAARRLGIAPRSAARRPRAARRRSAISRERRPPCQASGDDPGSSLTSVALRQALRPRLGDRVRMAGVGLVVAGDDERRHVEQLELGRGRRTGSSAAPRAAPRRPPRGGGGVRAARGRSAAACSRQRGSRPWS